MVSKLETDVAGGQDGNYTQGPNLEYWWLRARVNFRNTIGLDIVGVEMRLSGNGLNIKPHGEMRPLVSEVRPLVALAPSPSRAPVSVHVGS